MSSSRHAFAETGLVRAEAKHVRTSARKVRLVLEDIRGRSVVDARRQLLFSPRDAAKDVELVLRSAVANAEVNHGLSPDDLVVHAAFANEATTIKRFKPRARGRASRINKRMSHITILLRALTGGELAAGTAAPAKATADATRAKRVAASKQADGAAEAEAAFAVEEQAAEAPKKPRAPKKTKAAEGAEAGTAEAKPAAKKPAAKKPAAEKPAAAKKPAARKPAAKKPAADKPAADEGKD